LGKIFRIICCFSHAAKTLFLLLLNPPKKNVLQFLTQFTTVKSGTYLFSFVLDKATGHKALWNGDRKIR
jgi:hypothetical protein